VFDVAVRAMTGRQRSQRVALPLECAAVIRAVFWDFGGVILTSPFETFNAYERANALPLDFIRTLNSRDPDTNAWARFERQEIAPDEFDALFAAESEAAGHRVPRSDVISMLSGAVRPEMVRALERVVESGYVTACLTNNVVSDVRRVEAEAVMAKFDHVIESSKVGLRKPEREFYELACKVADVEPHEVVFLDDLGINLKPAKAMGMTTIKVVSPAQAIADLEAVLGISLD
jgi:putative hydrolase of the HAD superfamily